MGCAPAPPPSPMVSTRLGGRAGPEPNHSGPKPRRECTAGPVLFCLNFRCALTLTGGAIRADDVEMRLTLEPTPCQTEQLTTPLPGTWVVVNCPRGGGGESFNQLLEVSPTLCRMARTRKLREPMGQITAEMAQGPDYLTLEYNNVTHTLESPPSSQGCWTPG